MPIDTTFDAEHNLERGLIDLDLVKGRMELATETNVLLIDACRDNPLSKTLSVDATKNPKRIGVGLLPMRNTGTLIGYSTSPGTEAAGGLDGGRNSPYAKSLLQHLEVPSLDLAAVLSRVRNDVSKATNGDQVPWDLSNLVAPITLNAGTPGQQKISVVRGGVSDRALAFLMDFAWNFTPSRFTRPDGTLIEIDKTKRASIMPSSDVARDVMYVGKRTAWANACGLRDDAGRNYRALMANVKKSTNATAAQLFYLERVHFTVNQTMSGTITITDKDGAQSVVVDASRSLPCDEAFKAFVARRIDKYAGGQ